MHHKIAIRVDPEDNVLVALTDIKCSTEIADRLCEDAGYNILSKNVADRLCWHFFQEQRLACVV